jgi:DNA-binding SARP family transcriptional activator
MIQLRTFGTLDLNDSQGSTLRSILAQPRRVALLIHLAIASPPGFHRRDRLLTLFWPDHDADRARAALNRALYFLRRELGAGILLSRGQEEIGLDTSRFWCDAAAFEAAIARGQPAEALALYSGDLLPGFFASNARGFEEWLETERARFRERAAECAWLLAAADESSGNVSQAAHWARRGVEIAPFREMGVRRLLALLDRAGDRAGAAQAYQRFAHVLAREFELAPAPETRALIDAIRTRETQLAESIVPARIPASTAPSERVAAAKASGAAPAARTKRHRPGRRFALVAGVALAAIVLGLARRSRPALDPERVDVLVFENRTGTQYYSPLGRSAAQQIRNDLRAAALFQTVSVVETKSGLMSWASVVSRLAKSKREQAAIEVSGEISREGQNIVVQAWINDHRVDREPWPVAPMYSPADSVQRAIDQVRTRVVGGIAAIRNPTTARYFPVVTPPPTYEAFLEYREGWRLRNAGMEHARTRDQFRVAVARDSTFTWPLLEVAQTELWRGEYAYTDSMLTTLSQLRPRLPAFQQHLLDYLQATRLADWPRVHQAMHQLAELAPLQYMYSYAATASQGNQPREALAALARYRQAMVRAGLDSLLQKQTPYYWNLLTLQLHQLDEHRNELAAAHQARAHRPESVMALMQEMRALIGMKRTQAVLARMDTLLLLPRDGWLTPALALQSVALELRAHGQRAAATEALQRARAWLLARPEQEAATGVHRATLAATYYYLDHLAEAEPLFRQLHAEEPEVVDHVGFLGVIAARRGDRAAAEAIVAQLARLPATAPAPGDDTILWRAKIAALLDDRERAMSLLTDAFGSTGSFQTHVDFDFESLRDYPPYREFIRAKD